MEEHLNALRLVVGDYIAERDDDAVVDWEFIAKRNMQTPQNWQAEDKKRHKRSMDRLVATGYVVAKKKTRKKSSST